MQFSDLDLEKTYSYADYTEWTFDAPVELIDGKVYQVMHPNTYHQSVLVELIYNLRSFLTDRTACKIFVAPFDVRLSEKGTEDQNIFTVIKPDICVVCDLTKIDKRGCIGAPDIIIEVLNPGNNSKELREKLNLYEASGVTEYWIVSPQYQYFIAYTLRDGKYKSSRIMCPTDFVTSSVFPGFSLDLTELFKDIELEEDKPSDDVIEIRI